MPDTRPINLDDLATAVVENRRKLVREQRRKFEASKRRHERERLDEIKAGGDGKWYDDNPPKFDDEDEMLGNLASNMTLALIAIAQRLEATDA